MGFFFTAGCIGLTIFAIKKIIDSKEEKRRRIDEENRRRIAEKKRRKIDEENRRKNTVCYFNGSISRDEFYEMVELGRRGIRRITRLYADGPVVYGTVRSHSGISEWYFKIDFNDYGNITGNYWLSSDNYDSDIPNVVANRISQQINDRLN